TSPAPWVHELTGLAWQGAEVTLEPAAGGKRLARRRRPVLFTHTGISGPGAMDVSAHVARGGAFRLRVDAFPDIEREALRAAFVDAARLPGNPRVQRALGEMETGPMPRRLFEAFAAQASVPPGVALGELSKSGRHGLVEALKGLEVPVDGTRGWDHAEVTAGGLALREVDPRSMAVNGRSGLFVIGELLDVDGPIGGLSFQAAFSTAEVAGRALAAQV
ncbi:MAG: NAD(P)/FAD-dependent oxidoreductase, partial [Planctomycetota bacterium]